MFVYYNANPKNERIGDCVVRAISTALGIEYYKVLNMLYNNSNYFNCDMLVKDCYIILLNDYYGLKCYKGMGKSAKEIANDFKDKKLILRTEGHVLCAKYGDIYDTWDSSNEIVDIFWIVD